METDTSERRCLTCGGPAVLCLQTLTCVARDIPVLRPPDLDGRRYSRTTETVLSFGWRVKAPITFALWYPVLVCARNLTEMAAPLALFAGVPLTYVAVRVTRELWQSRRVS